jgi:hypothetical protein
MVSHSDSFDVRHRHYRHPGSAELEQWFPLAQLEPGAFALVARHPWVGHVSLWQALLGSLL